MQNRRTTISSLSLLSSFVVVFLLISPTYSTPFYLERECEKSCVSTTCHNEPNCRSAIDDYKTCLLQVCSTYDLIDKCGAIQCSQNKNIDSFLDCFEPCASDLNSQESSEIGESKEILSKRIALKPKLNIHHSPNKILNSEEVSISNSKGGSHGGGSHSKGSSSGKGTKRKKTTKKYYGGYRHSDSNMLIISSAILLAFLL